MSLHCISTIQKYWSTGWSSSTLRLTSYLLVIIMC